MTLRKFQNGVPVVIERRRNTDSTERRFARDETPFDSKLLDFCGVRSWSPPWVK